MGEYTQILIGGGLAAAFVLAIELIAKYRRRRARA